MALFLGISTIALSLAATALAGPECLQQPQTGSCRDYSVKYYFNPFTGECHEFMYGGCGGNGNRFETEAQCVERCEDLKVNKKSHCGRAPDSGPCRGHLERYYYDTWSRRCEVFEYGGCRGNGNNFKTFEECMQTCSRG